MALCDCACLSANSEQGMKACQTGCELFEDLEEAIVNNSPNVEPTASPTSTKISTTSTSTSTSSVDDSTTTTNSTGRCSDNDEAATRLFEELFGMSLSCPRIATLNGCNLKEWMVTVRGLCPVSCGLCTTEVTEKPPKTDTKTEFPIIPIAAILGSIFVLGLVVVVIVLRKQQERKVGPSKPTQQAHTFAALMSLAEESSTEEPRQAWGEQAPAAAATLAPHEPRTIYLSDFEEPVESEY